MPNSSTETRISDLTLSFAHLNASTSPDTTNLPPGQGAPEIAMF
jgi:hypothetical protein